MESGKRVASKETLLSAACTALRRGESFLRSRQRKEGCWTDFKVFNTPGTEWVTGYVGLELSKLSDRSDRSVLASAISFLTNSQRFPGGWGFHKAAPVDADSTACCLRFLLNVKGADPSLLRQGWSALLVFQDPKCGGFRTYLPSEKGIHPQSGYVQPSPCVTACVIGALSKSDRDIDIEATSRAIANLLDEQETGGAWRSFWWADLIYPTCFCLQALSVNPAGTRAVSRGREWLKGVQNEDGSWGDESGECRAINTGLATAALVRFGSKTGREMIDRAIAWLVETQLDDGSWKSGPVMRAPSLTATTRWQAGDGEPLVADNERVFTTATVIGGLRMYQHFCGRMS
jgi:squalene cyclase